MINHAVVKAALFGAAGLLLLRLGSVRLTALAGLGRRMPWTFAAIVVAGLGLVGVPPTAGFVSKWALVTALIEQGQWPVLVAMLASSLLALVYVGRIVEVAWFREPRRARAHRRSHRPRWSPRSGSWCSLSVYFGLDATLPAGLADARRGGAARDGGG